MFVCFVFKLQSINITDENLHKHGLSWSYAQAVVTNLSVREAYCKCFEVVIAACTEQKHPLCVHSVYVLWPERSPVSKDVSISDSFVQPHSWSLRNQLFDFKFILKDQEEGVFSVDDLNMHVIAACIVCQLVWVDDTWFEFCCIWVWSVWSYRVLPSASSASPTVSSTHLRNTEGGNLHNTKRPNTFFTFKHVYVQLLIHT